MSDVRRAGRGAFMPSQMLTAWLSHRRGPQQKYKRY